MQSNITVQNSVRDLTIGQMEGYITKTMALTGAKDLEEALAMIDSRHNNTKVSQLNAIPLGDWCKDNNKHIHEVFLHLKCSGLISEDDNLVMPKMFDTVLDIYKGNVKQSALPIFNTKKRVGKYTVMINSGAKQYPLLKAYIDEHCTLEYKGSKGFTGIEVCRAMKRTCRKSGYIIIKG